MLNSRWVLFMTAAISFSALGKASFEEMQERVASLETLSAAHSLNVDAYRRELNYEKLNLALEDRAKAEANLLASRVRLQVKKAFEAALSENRDEQLAYEEVREAILKDLELASPELKAEINELALDALNNVQNGKSTQNTELPKVEGIMLQKVSERAAFLHNDPPHGNGGKSSKDEKKETPAKPVYRDPFLPSGNPSKDAEKRDYSSRQEFVEALVSDRENTRWTSTANMSLRSATARSNDSRVRLQVKIEFLGSEIEAGPVIQFRREFQSNASISAEGLHPVLLKDGNFDFYKRNQDGKVIVSAEKLQKRFIFITCNAEMYFETEYTGSGGFRFAGSGADSSFSKKFSNSVELTSRRVHLPEYIGGKSVTMDMVRDICHKDFLKAKFSHNLSVEKSLDLMMKNVVSSLRFSHPKTKCATDLHCVDWFNREVLSLVRSKNYPRCVEESSREKYRACSLRGLEGQNCPLIKDGKRISEGLFEYTCDQGLKCVQTKTGGWFTGGELYQYPEGRCMPINSRTYKNPKNTRYLEINLQN